MKYKFTRGEKMTAGAIVGGIVGVVAGAVATVWGGYEIGTAINDAINLQGTVGRGLVDLIMMGVVAGPAISAGFYGGAAAGGAVGAILPSSRKKKSDLEKKIDNTYNKTNYKGPNKNDSNYTI